ncbi:MAG: bacteriocin family protein [Helicobacteraceae bacterium]|nr:bacteriocin family protein [Helicobacteraceae bacterium]
MSLLKRHLAPFGEEVWSAIEGEAAAVFKRRLTSRKVADFKGGLGLAFAGANSGRVTAVKEKLRGATVGIRETLPVIELKVPFTLKRSETELLLREAGSFDNTAVVDAANALCAAENSLVFDGYKNIDGIVSAVANAPVKVAGDDILTGVGEAIYALKNAHVGGKYALLIQPQYYAKLFTLSGSGGYPLTKKLGELLGGGEVIATGALKEGALVVSLRGGDYEILSGVDISIGYDGALPNGDCELFFFETLTFRVNTPEAAVKLSF